MVAFAPAPSYKDFWPHAGPQTDFLSSEADVVFYGGQAGGGKTRALLMEASRYTPVLGYRGVIFRRTLTQVKNEGGLWDESSEMYPYLGAHGVPGIYEWRFPVWTENAAGHLGEPQRGETTVRFAHLQHEEDKREWQGSQIPFIGFDELTHFSEGQFFYLLSRSRSTIGVKPYVRATMNADADSWVAGFIEWWIDQEEFYEDGEPNERYGFPIPERAGVVRYFVRLGTKIHWGDTKEELYDLVPDDLLREGSTEDGAPTITKDDLIKSFTFIPASIFDNPTLLRENPGYLADLLAQEEVEKQRLLYGNWKARAEAGKVFNRYKAGIVNAPPANVIARVRYWDNAGTEERDAKSDVASFSAGVKLSIRFDGRITIEDVRRGQWDDIERESIKLATAKLDGKEVPIRIEQEPGSSGKDIGRQSVRMLAGFDAVAKPASGSKDIRQRGLAAQWQAGNVDVVLADWTEDYLKEMHSIGPGVKIRDQADASAAAFNFAVDMSDSPDPDAKNWKRVRQ